MTLRLDVRRRRLDLRVIISVAIWISACSNPTSSGPETINLGGVVRDASRQPVGDAQIEILTGPFGGRFTMSDAQGRFQFVDPPSVADPVTLRVSKAGYLSTLAQAGRDQAIITVTLSAEPATFAARRILVHVHGSRGMHGAPRIGPESDLFGAAQRLGNDSRVFQRCPERSGIFSGTAHHLGK